MISREGEPTGFLDLPKISPKTSSEQLLMWSKEVWKSDSRNRVARDMVNNGKELLFGSNIDWNLVLSKISARKMGAVVFGEAAIAADCARFVGGLASRAGWSMHDPQSVYLSGKYLADTAGSKLEDFKTTMTLASVCYMEKTMPEAESLMKTLDLLLGNPRIRNRSSLLTKIATLLHDGNVQDAYLMVSSREDLVRRREPVSSKTTTSSILIPPKPGR